MKASAMFDTVQDVAKFIAKPQAVQYTTGDVYEQIGSFWIDFTVEPFMNLEDMKERVRNFNGVLVVNYVD